MPEEIKRLGIRGLMRSDALRRYRVRPAALLLGLGFSFLFVGPEVSIRSIDLVCPGRNRIRGPNCGRISGPNLAERAEQRGLLPDCVSRLRHTRRMAMEAGIESAG
jgi:hypothetical protein